MLSPTYASTAAWSCFVLAYRNVASKCRASVRLSRSCDRPAQWARRSRIREVQRRVGLPNISISLSSPLLARSKKDVSLIDGRRSAFPVQIGAKYSCVRSCVFPDGGRPARDASGGDGDSVPRPEIALHYLSSHRCIVNACVENELGELALHGGRAVVRPPDGDAVEIEVADVAWSW